MVLYLPQVPLPRMRGDMLMGLRESTWVDCRAMGLRTEGAAGEKTACGWRSALVPRRLARERRTHLRRQRGMSVGLG